MSVKLGTLTLDLVARVSSFTQGMNQASTSAEREMRRVENSVVSASGAIKSLAATAAASFSVAQISNYSDEFINLQNRLKLVTGSTQELTQATKDTYAIAQATAGSWDSTVQVYQRFAQNAKALGINLSQVASLTDTVSKAIAISGGTAASSEAALVQFGQALSSGVLRGEEFNSIAEQAGGLRDAIARGLNLSAGDLKKWAADGKLTTDIVIKALQESKVSVDDLFNKTDFTGAQGFKKLSTATTLYIGDLSKSTGASKAMYESLSYLSENLEKVTSVAAVGAAYLAGTYIPVIYKSVVAKKTKIASMIEEIQIENASIVQSQRKAQAELTAAQAEMTRARDSVIAAEMEVNADRAVIASEIQRMQATVAATNVEKAQEAQRLKNQTTDTGRTQSITRMAQLQQVQAIQVAELTALEAKLGATVVATSQQYTAARNVQASATARLTVATSELNVANAMTTRTSVGLMGALGGPVGLGLLVAGVAASYLMLRDSTKDTTSTLDLQKGTVSELVAEYSKLDDLQKRTTMRELEKQVKDLSTAYTVSFSDLNAFIGWLEDSGSVSESTAKKVNALFKEYRLGGLSASEFATAINGLSGVQDKHKQKIDDLTTAQAKSKTEYEKVKTAQDALTKQTSAAIGANEKETASINAKGLALEKLNQKQQDALNGIKGDIAREAYIIANMKAGFSRDKSEFYADYRSKAELGYVGKSISSEESATVAAGYKLKQQNEARLASEKAIEASQKKQTKEAEKKYQYTQAEAKLLSKAYGDVSKSGLGAYAESRGIPANVIAGLYMQESKAGTDLTSHTRAKGNWQTTTRYREQNNISMADNNDFLKVGKIVVDNIAKVFADTGSLKQAILSHNAGETGASNFMKDGRVKGSGVRNKEVAGYLPSIDKWASWGSGNKGELLGESDSGKDYQDFLDAQLKKQEAVKQLQSQFDTEAIQRSKERDELINQATILGQTHLIPKIKERYNQQELLASYQLELELNGYKWGEDQKIAYRRDIEKLELEISGKYGAEETKLRKNGIDALKQYEIDEYRKTQQLKIAEYQLAFSQPLTELQAEVLDMQAKANMGGGYGAWALQNQYGKDLGSFGAEYDKNVDNINEDKTITDDAVRKQMLLDAEESFRLSKLKLNEKYTLLEQDLAKSQHQEQLQIWGSLLGQAQNTWSQITQVVKDSNGEQSTSFKIAFAAQQMFAMGSATISALQAYNQILASPWYMDVMSKTTAANMVLGMGMANVGMIGAQALTGMAHNGIDNIPKEGTWLLDGGERVLNPQQNKDLTNYLSKGSGGGNVEVNVQVTDSGVTSQSNQTDQKQLGQMIGNAVRAVIMQEKRQGGLLAK